MEFATEGFQDSNKVAMRSDSDNSGRSTLLLEIDSENTFPASDELPNSDFLSYNPSEYESDVKALLQDLHRTSLSEENRINEKGLSTVSSYDISPFSELPVFPRGKDPQVDESQDLFQNRDFHRDSSCVFVVC